MNDSWLRYTIHFQRLVVFCFVFVSVALLLFVRQHNVQAVDTEFQTTADHGFGAIGNARVGSVQGATLFNGRVYIAGESTFQGAQMWSSTTGQLGSWRHDINDGFASGGVPAGNNTNIGALEVFNGNLYAGTSNNIDGFQLWRWDGGIGNAWQAISATGVGAPLNSQFGQGPGIVSHGLTSAETSGGALFVGSTKSATVWRSTDGSAWSSVTDINFSRADDSTVNALLESGEFLYAAVSADVVGTADIWRCAVSTNCDIPGEWGQVFDASTAGVTVNQDVFSLTEYAGYLYAAGDVGSIYRCSVADCDSQLDWTPVTQNGFGDGATIDFTGFVSHAGNLYALSSVSLGAKVWRSADGVTFTDITPVDFSGVNESVLQNAVMIGNDLIAFVDHASGFRPKLADLDPILIGDPVASSRNNGEAIVDVDVSFSDPDITRSGQLRVEFSTNAGVSWNNATISSRPANTFATNGALGVNNAEFHQIGTEASGFINAQGVDPTISFAWNAFLDLPAGQYNQLQLRVTPYDGIANGVSRTSNIFTLFVSEQDEPDQQVDGDIDVIDLQAGPQIVRRGAEISIGFIVIGQVEGLPEVTVDGQDAEFQREIRANGRSVYSYTYRVRGPDVEAEAIVDVVVRAQSQTGETDQEQVQVELDFSPPRAAINTQEDGDGQLITMQGSDPRQFGIGEGSGIAAIYYTINDPNISDQSRRYNAPFYLREGDWTLRWFAVDRAGNKSSVQGVVYRIGSDGVILSEEVCEDLNGSECDLTLVTTPGVSWVDRLLQNRRLISIPLSVAAIALSAANIAFAAAQVLTYSRYLWQIFTEPLRWIAGKRRSSWGVVVDADTNISLDLVTVRLIDVATGRPVQTSVTDSSGRFLFVGEPGRYKIEAIKTGYYNLSGISEESIDRSNVRAYAGGIIEVGNEQKESVMNVRIELKRKEGFVEVARSTQPVWVTLTTKKAWENASDVARKEDDQRVISAQRWRRVAAWLSYIGPILGLAILWIDPSWFNALLFVIHVLLFILFRRLARRKKGSQWGMVKDLTSTRPLRGAVVRLFSEKHGRLLLSRVTSGAGKYGFLVGDGEYRVSGQKDGYIAQRPFVFVRAGKDAIVNEDINLRKHASRSGVYE